MKIELTERQCFAIAKSGIKNHGTRKRFGEENLGKIFVNALKEVPTETYQGWLEEWKKIVAEIENETVPKKIKSPIQGKFGDQKIQNATPKRIEGYIVKD